MMALIRPDFDSTVAVVQMPVILTQHWNYGRWVIGTSLVFWLSWQGYYFITAGILGIKEVASLRALQNFVLPLSQFITSLSLLAIPWASGKFAANDQKVFRRAVVRISLLFTAAGIVYFVFISVFGFWLVRHIYNGKYDQSSALLPMLALSGAFIAAAQGPNIALRAMRTPSDVFIGYSTSACFTLATGFALTRYWGLAGAAFGMAASSFCFLVTLIWRYRLRIGRLTPGEQTAGPRHGRSQIRVAWLMPSLNRGFYWQPVFKEFAQRFPKSIVFTGFWPGFVPGYEGTFELRMLSGYKFITLKRFEGGYDRGVVKPPISILPELFKFRPQVIFSSAFTAWTLCALIFKAFTRTRVYIVWEGTSPSVRYQDRPIRLKIRRVMSRFVDGGISNTSEGIEYLRDVLSIPNSKLLHHLYEVPMPEVLCSGAATAELDHLARPIFLFVGSLIPRKGLDRLLDAADLLVQRGLDSFSVVIVGAGEGVENLQEQILCRKLTGTFHYSGPVRYENLGAYYKASDVFVFPTLEDVLGLVLLEAMAFGKPVLCSQYAGSREMVQHNVNGFIFDPRKPAELAEYMAKFIENRQMIADFGTRSSEAIAPYTVIKAADAFESLVNGAPWSSEKQALVEEDQSLAFD
jgi:glycosyltransferase involved in cell wall biosynthesis